MITVPGSGNLDIFRDIIPILPWKYDCDYCGNPADGSHGYMWSEKVSWVCKNCYANVVGLRPLGEKHLLDTWENTIIYVSC